MKEQLNVNVREVFSASVREANKIQEEIKRLVQIEDRVQDLIDKKVREIKGFEKALDYEGVESITKDKIRDIVKPLKLTVNDLCWRIGKNKVYES